MASTFAAINARIRQQPVLNYVCSTHFWGPVSNFGIPIAAVADTQKDAEIISGRMTGALMLYSGTFMRYALAVSPKNYLLFGCHVVNFGAQSTQLVRWQRYWYGGGRETDLGNKAKEGVDAIKAEGSEVAEKAKGAAEAAKEKVSK